MPEQYLDVNELGAGLQEPCSVGVPEPVGRDRLIDAGPIEEPQQVGPHHMGDRRLAPGVLANTKSSLPLSFSQNPNTCLKLSGRGTRRSRLPLPMTRTL
jgi:hypothetical protein